MHIHLGLIDFLIFVLYLVIAKFLIHMLTGALVNTPFGEALAFLA